MSKLVSIFLMVVSLNVFAQDAQVNLERGIQSFEVGQLTEARKFLDQVLLEDARNARAYYWLGRVAEKENKTDEALVFYEKSYTIDSKSNPTIERLGLMKFVQKDINSAKGYLEQAQKNGSQNAQVYARLGQIADMSQGYKKSQGLYEKAVSLDPLNEAGRMGVITSSIAQGKKASDMVFELENMKMDFPKNYEMRKLLADAHAEKNDPNTAIKEYSQILKENPKHGETWLALGRSLSLSQRNEQAAKALDSAMIHNAPKDQVFFEQGRVQYNLKKPKEALALFQKCTQENVELVACWNYQARIYIEMKDYGMAESSLTNALQTPQGKTAPTYSLLGDVYFQQKDYSKAQSAYQRSLSIDKNSPAAHYGLGRVYDEQGNDKNALSSYQKVPKENTSFYQKSVERQGYIHLRSGRFDRAFSTFQTATSLNPQDPYLWNAFGESAYGIKDYTTALDSFNRAIAFQTPFYKPFENKALTYKTLEQWASAKKTYLECVAHEPNKAEHWENLYFVASKEDDTKTKVDALIALERIEPKNVNHPYRLGVLFAQKDSPLQAEDSLKRALKIEPNHTESLIALGDISFRSKDYGQAKNYYQRILKQDAKHLVALDRMAYIAFDEKNYRASSGYDLRYMQATKDSAHQTYRYAVARDRMKDSPKVLLGLYQKAYDLDNNNARAGIRVAQLKENLGDQKGAIAQYERVLSKTPETHEAMEEKALILLSLGRHKEAASQFEELHKQRGPSQVSSLGLARSYRYMNDNKQAERSYELALSLYEDQNEEVLYELALVQNSLGKKQEAKDSLTKIILRNPNNVQAQELLGDLYVENKEHKNAVTHYQKAVDVKPDNAKGHKKLGLALHASGQNEEALQSFKRSVNLDSSLHKSYYAMGQIETARSLEHYQKAAELKADSLEYQLAFANALFEQKKFSQAVIVYQKAEKINPNHIEVLMGLGATHEELKQHDKAADSYGRVAKVDPKHRLAWIAKGRNHVALNDHKRAAESFEKAYQLNKKDVQVAFDRAVSYEKSVQTKNAILAYQDVLGLEPTHFGALFNLGKIYYDANDFALAKVELEKASRVKPRNWETALMLGDIYFRENDFASSFTAYTVVKQEAPDLPIAYLRLGMIHNQRGQLQDAEKELKKCISLDAKNALAHYELGTVYEKMDNKSQALTNYEKATSLDDKYAQAHFAKANLYDAKSQRKRKERSYQRAIEIDGKYTEARQALAAMYEGNQEYTLAMDQYRAILGYDANRRQTVMTLGQLGMAVDKPDLAAKDMSAFAKNHPKDTEVQYLLGKAYYQNGSLKDARRVFSQVILLDAQYAEAHTMLGLIEIKEGKHARAKKAFERSLDIKENQALAHYGLGQVMIQEKNYNKAVSHEKRALELDPSLMDAYFHLGVAYKALGKEKEADEAFSKTVPVDGIDGVRNPKDLDKAFQNFDR